MNQLPDLHLFPLTDLQTRGYAQPEPRDDVTETGTAVDDTGEEEAA
ncbi:hypothetical protein ABZ819_04915 [Streptomyces venezuelae]